MSRQKKLKNTSKSQNKPCEDEPTLDKSNIKLPLKDIEDTFCLQKKDASISTVEFPHKNKKKTSKDKSNICDPNIQNTKSSKTLAVESISKDMDFSPFYDESSEEMFRKLWLALPTDLFDLIPNSLSGFSNSLGVNSFTLTEKNIDQTNKNYLETFYRSLQFLQPDTMEEDDIIATRKIRIFPSVKQKSYFNKCFGTTRYIYNKGLEAINNAYDVARNRFKEEAKKGCIAIIKSRKTKEERQCCANLEGEYFCKEHKDRKLKYGVPLGFIHWRDEIVKSNDQLNDNEKWLAEIKYDTRQLVIKNLLGGIKAAITNLKNGNIQSFNMKYKSKKNKNQFFFVDHRAIKEGIHLWPSEFDHPLRMRKGEKKWFNEFLSENITTNSKGKKKYNLCDMIITREYPNKYYLHVPYYKDKIDKKPKSKIISIDPGIRTFNTIYDPEGIQGKLGDGLANRIMKLYVKIDKLKSKISKTNTKNNDKGYLINRRRRQKMRRECAQLRTKIGNIVKDHHWKIASFYCKNYEYIMIPKMNVKSLQKSIKRMFGCSKSSPHIRRLMSLSHCKFIERLKFKANEYGRKLIIVDEHYTSKTCGNCGALHKSLGASIAYCCKYCGIIIDRDINGARNILIKNSVNGIEKVKEMDEE